MFQPPPQSPKLPADVPGPPPATSPTLTVERRRSVSDTVGTYVVNPGPNAMSEHGFDLDDDRNMSESDDGSEYDESGTGSEEEETGSEEYSSDESATDHSYSQS